MLSTNRESLTAVGDEGDPSQARGTYRAAHRHAGFGGPSALLVHDAELLDAAAEILIR
jgi:hypothetical protein